MGAESVQEPPPAKLRTPPLMAWRVPPSLKVERPLGVGRLVFLKEIVPPSAMIEPGLVGAAKRGSKRSMEEPGWARMVPALEMKRAMVMEPPLEAESVPALVKRPATPINFPGVSAERIPRFVMKALALVMVPEPESVRRAMVE